MKRRIAINPKLRSGFECTSHTDRSATEMKRWWRRPFILSEEYSQEEWESMTRQDREKWLAEYPTGKRYNVRRLDGGAWDRSTSYGFFPTIKQAMNVAEGLR